MWSAEIAIIAAMIALNSLFAAYEIALASVSLSRLHVLQQHGRAGARAALVMKQRMEGSLAVVQLGITLVGAIAAATGGAGAEENLAPWIRSRVPVTAAASEAIAITVIVLPLTALTIVFGELIPKVFALRNKEWVCLRMSPPMHWFALMVWPVVWILESTVSLLMRWGERHWQHRLDRQFKSESAELQELRTSVALARTSRMIGHQEERIILGAASLAEKRVCEIMLPAEHIRLLDATKSVGEALIAAHLDMHTRFPVAEKPGDPQSIIGYVTFKDIVAHMRLTTRPASIRSILRTIVTFAENTPVPRCLERIIREHTHIALVRNAEGVVLGMVTLEDIIEELVGEIEDEYDRLPSHVVATGESWIAGGGVTLSRLKELSGIDMLATPSAAQSRNLSEWIAAALGRPVEMGEVAQVEGLRIVIRKVRRGKVQEAQLEPLAPAG